MINKLRTNINHAIRHDRVAIINNIYAPYRHELFIILDNMCGPKELEFVYLSDTEKVRKWKTDVMYTQLRNVTVLKKLIQLRNNRTSTSDFILNYGIVKYFFYDTVLIFGYNYPTYLIILFARCLLNKKTVLFCESTNQDKRHVHPVTELFKKLVFQSVSHVIVPGSRSADYVAQYTNRDKITTATNAVASEEPLKELTADQEATESKLKLLFVGRLSSEKNIDFAIHSLLDSDLDFTLNIVGSGDLENNLKEQFERSNIIFHGEASWQRLTNFYRKNDILLLPSESEPWGLVVNEALSFGMPAVVSDRVGCVPELIDGSGETFRFGNPRDFIDKVKKVSENQAIYQKGAKEISRHFTITRQAKVIWGVIANG